MISDGGGGVGGGNYWSSVGCGCWSGDWGRSNGMANALAAAYYWASLFNGEIWDGDATWSSMTAGSTGGGWRRWQHRRRLAVAAGKAAVGGWSALVVAVLLNLCLWRRLWRRLRDMVINDMIENHMPCELIVWRYFWWRCLLLVDFLLIIRCDGQTPSYFVSKKWVEYSTPRSTIGGQDTQIYRSILEWYETSPRKFTRWKIKFSSCWFLKLILWDKMQLLISL